MSSGWNLMTQCHYLLPDHQKETPRRSSRLDSKRNRPAFKLPTRDTIWNDIPSIKSSKLHHLSPRKSVNEFTKVYNSYNYDDYEDTSDDADSTSVSSSESEDEEVKTPSRIKNFHKRLKKLSSSSSEEDNMNVISDNEKETSEAVHRLSDTDTNIKSLDDNICTDEDGVSETNAECSNKDTLNPDCSNKDTPDPDFSTINRANCPTCERGDGDTSVVKEQDDSSDSGDSDEVISPSRRVSRLSRHSVLESDEEEDSPHIEDVPTKHESVECHDNDDSGSGTDADSEYEHDDDRFNRAFNLKEKKKQLFSEFKESMMKRKSKLQATNLNPP